jgi:hypothetical protein
MFTPAVMRWIKGAAITLLFCSLMIGMARSNQTGPVPGVTGVPGADGVPPEPTCIQSGCHESFPLNPDTKGKIELAGVPDNYVPGRTYRLMFSITHPDSDRRRWGFEVTAVLMQSYLPAGNLELSTVAAERRTTQKIVDPMRGDRQYIGHSVLGTGQNRTGGFSWIFNWVAPNTSLGDVAFYGAGNAANNDSNPLKDYIYNPTPNPLALAKGQFGFTNVAAAAKVATETGGGVAVGDYNKDGRPDIFIARDGQAGLYRNNGDGTFTDVAAQAGITTAQAQGRAAAWGDYDGDGNLDLYVVNAGADALYRNTGNGTFTNVSAAAGISDQAAGNAVAWGDLNGDKLLDMYVANDGQDILYLNNGTGSFAKANPAMNGLAEQSLGRAVALADYNGDSRLDVLVANDGQALLYRNNGDGTFSDQAMAAGIQAANAQSRAAAWADFDKDGRPDLFIANVGQDLLFKNKGDGTFSDVTMAAGLGDMAVGAAAAWGDYDKDGDPDLFVANEGQDFLYRNNGNGTFNEVATHSGMTDTASGRDAAWLDFDKDEHLDLFVSNATGGNALNRNPGRSGPPPASVIGSRSQGGNTLISAALWLVTTMLLL